MDEHDDVNELAMSVDMPEGVDRRSFMKQIAFAAAATGLTADAVLHVVRPGLLSAQQQQQPAVVLPELRNGEAPALMFQAYPGGTGALIEKLARERGYASFERTKMTVAPWTGAVPTTEEDVVFQPVHRLSALVKARRISSVDLTNMYLERLKRLDPVLLCAVTIMEGPAREAAQQADAEIRAGRYRGPLHGIPWGVKDLFATKGVRTTWGTNDYQNQMIDVDSEVVVRLRDAGAVLIAKLATGQFAQGDTWYRGITKNPWNPTQGASGSSAGPGSATAAGCVAFAIGTETQGSIVSPTIRNGLSALRPTFGRVSRHGGMVLAWSMDKVGPMCRTIEDCALVFNTIHGADEKDAATITTPFKFDSKIDLKKLRIGFDERAPADVVAKLRELGADMKPMPARPDSRIAGTGGLGVESAAAFDYLVSKLPPEPAVDSTAARDTTAGGRGRAGGGGGAGAPANNTPAAARSRFARGRTVTALDFLQSQRRRHILMEQMAVLMKDYDMYLSSNGDVGLTNQTGHPAAVFPVAFRAPTDGAPAQPICATIIGGLFEDDKILSVAHAYQKATSWHNEHPKL